jgi:tetratricopeptide (TPR) repeat protein
MEKHRNCLVLWIPATDPETLLQAYMAVARQLNIPRRDEKGADIMRLVQNYLSDENTGRWLLVFDNADDMDMWSKPVSEQTSNRLLDYLPKSKHGKIVFTTRDRKVAVKLAPRNIVEVREMNSDAATELLQKYLVEYDLAANSDATKALLAELTYLPLAIIQASAYIKANGVSIADYLSLLAEQDESTIELLSEDFEDDGRYENIKNPVATTWLISFERIQQRDPLAADYLSFMACIEPKEIPRTLLPEGPSRKKEMDALGTLDAYSFITRREAGVDQVFDLHHLVHLATRNWITEKGLIRQWVMRTIQRLNKVLPDNDDSRHTNITSWRKYLPHARCALLSDEIDRTGTDYTDLAWNLGSCLHSDGRYKEAELLFSEVTKRNRMVLGEEHLITLRSTADLATIFCKMGRLKEAEELEVKIKDTRIRVLGEEHPETLRSMANLAATYTYQGQWKEAEDLEVHVIDIRKRVLGEEHPNTLYTMANLTTTYMNQGRWREAHELGMQVRDATMRVLGEENLWTLRSLANLAATYRNQDQWKEAEKLEVQVMETRKRTLGEEHPDTLHGMNFLIRTYLGQEKLNEAEELSVQVMDATKRVLGEEHPDTQHAIENQAFLRKRQGQDTEAINLLANCVALRTRVLGADHRYTLYSVRSLAEWQAERLDEIIRSKGRS